MMTSKEKLMGILSYFGILFILPLFLTPDSQYAKFHANQGLLLFIANVVVGLLSIVPFIGGFLSSIGGVITVVLFILGLVHAIKEEMAPLPFIGNFQILK
ncbi:MAG: hypothetical protein IKK98_06460 [Oscillospiraceae bacterium]|nr:hypothetical protein [Oscillospiraceae bacterium]